MSKLLTTFHGSARYNEAGNLLCSVCDFVIATLYIPLPKTHQMERSGAWPRSAGNAHQITTRGAKRRANPWET